MNDVRLVGRVAGRARVVVTAGATRLTARRAR
jgi:hypothetical protein